MPVTVPVHPPIAPPGPVREELGLLSDVRRHLLEHPTGTRSTLSSQVATLGALLTEVGEAKGDDLPALLQQYDHLSSIVERRTEPEEDTDVDPDCPYFAHVRLDEAEGSRHLLLGRTTRVLPGCSLVDWRTAPVSGIFYRYEEGDEYEEELGDVVLRGRVGLRRTLGISGGRLNRVDTPDGTWIREGEAWIRPESPRPQLAGGTGAAFRAEEGRPPRLGTGRALRADKHLPAIAALIDSHQFQLITRPDSRVVVVRGGAGSGKTTVALHRVAWLQANDPRRYRPATMLVMTWGRGLRGYVSHVLPSLGVRDVRVCTWEEWSDRARTRHFPQLPRETRADTPRSLARVKHHQAFMRLLEERVRARPAPAQGREAVDDFVSLLGDADRVLARLQDLAPGDFSPALLEQAARQMRDQATALRAFLSLERDVPTALDPEDNAVLLRLWQLRVGPLRGGPSGPFRLSHLVVDEIQDFSPIEIRVLKECLAADGSATLAGDVMQHTAVHGGFASWEDLLGLPELAGTVVETLQISYRSARPILEFSRRLLGALAEAEPPLHAVREGPPVEFLPFPDPGAAVAFLADALTHLVRSEPLANVALIAPDATTAALYFHGLERCEVPRLRRVEEQRFSFAPGVEVVEIGDVKGLEFDYVVLLEATSRHYPDTDSARRALHMAATRAIHQLWVVASGTPAAALRPLVSAPVGTEVDHARP